MNPLETRFGVVTDVSRGDPRCQRIIMQSQGGFVKDVRFKFPFFQIEVGCARVDEPFRTNSQMQDVGHLPDIINLGTWQDPTYREAIEAC